MIDDLCQHNDPQHTRLYFESKSAGVILCSLHKKLFEEKFGKSDLDDWKEIKCR